MEGRTAGLSMSGMGDSALLASSSAEISSHIEWSSVGLVRVLADDNAEDTPKLANRLGTP